MKNIILILVSSLLLTGCSLIPRVTFDTPNTIPQHTDKSKAKNVCKGEAKFNENGDIIYCSRGYYLYNENFEKKERKYTLKESIINFFRGLAGWSFWIVIALIILAPGVLGAVVGRILEGTIGLTGQALKATIRGVQRARKYGKDLNDSLSAEQDMKVKKYIRKLKEKEKIK